MPVHSVDSRLKEKDSLERKLRKPGSDYLSLEDITDLVGCRIITYFADQVHDVASLIEDEFQVDRAKSVDKRTTLETDQFGYLSLHFIVRLNDTRGGLMEYSQWRKVQVEIQIRSILQHAWAEIEHDLGYKSATEIPLPVRRKFSRLAGLLEMADDSFDGIRRELAIYRNEIATDITVKPEEVLLDLDSLKAFVGGSKNVRELDAYISERRGNPLSDEIGDWIPELTFLGFKSIGELDRGLASNANGIREFVSRWFDRLRANDADWEGQSDRQRRGISIFYLGYLLIAARDSVREVIDYLDASSIGDDYEREWIAQNLQAIHRSMHPVNGEQASNVPEN